MTFNQIQQKIENAKELDFGQIFNDCIELFKKVWVQGLLMTLLTLAFAIPFVFVIYLPLIIFGVADSAVPASLMV